MRFSDFCFCDFEASSLSKESYPISFGWHSDFTSGQLYIVPESDWLDWSDESERIHGISRKFLEGNGLPAYIVANELNSRFYGRILVCDCLHFDSMWLMRLYSDLKMSPSFELIDVSELSHLNEDDLGRIYSRIKSECTHDACDDAMLLHDCVREITEEKNLLK
ncbi:hypothetical protein [Pseudoalteromonas marina]|uniref:Exonuclease domain-containing protein n=1 Tax=Pseudoalteromonas marina TaxID=267375 RepID=A0ABT9FGF1_9GAMM|nr:hypothetical protein [Pseudoalteromonas marina]MDP2565860.1 hypothetical protein [Pseudoalteromonas marina]